MKLLSIHDFQAVLELIASGYDRHDPLPDWTYKRLHEIFGHEYTVEHNKLATEVWYELKEENQRLKDLMGDEYVKPKQILRVEE